MTEKQTALFQDDRGAEMFTMTPYQSWISVVLLLLLVATVIWAFRDISEKRAERVNAEDRSSEGQQAFPAREPRAIVTDMRTRRQIGHLTLVHDNTRAPSPALYDWQKQGI